MVKKVYCVKCEQSIPQGLGGFGAEESFEYRDGVYCRECHEDKRKAMKGGKRK